MTTLSLNISPSEGKIKSTWTKLDQFYYTCDKKILNRLSHYPLISNVSGCIRVALAATQFLTGTFGAFYESTRELFSSTPSIDRTNQFICCAHTFHARDNLFRGALEISLPLINSLIFGYYDYLTTDEDTSTTFPYYAELLKNERFEYIWLGHVSMIRVVRS